MMENGSPERWLIREVSDLMLAGSVGLYELRWLLNSSDYSLSEARVIEVSRTAVKSIVRDGAAEMYTLQWPTAEIVAGPQELAILDGDSNWINEPMPRYVALVPMRDH